MPLLLVLWHRIFSIASAVLTGTVDFSTTILSLNQLSTDLFIHGHSTAAVEFIHM
ncbi:hypothetical protein GLYMA_14G115225v4 [Glycine max]|nr:hypothetical protein GLYMA_14G115225v4 [Glycine max]KAH1094136.1 hypothetical protein GYH30_039736 [Glycine max]